MDSKGTNAESRRAPEGSGEHVSWNRAARWLADRTQAVGAALRTNGQLRDVRFWSDDIGPVGNGAGTLAVLQCPRILGTLELLKMGIAATDRRGGPCPDVPARPRDGEDDYGGDDQTEHEFPGLEYHGRVVARLGWLVIHR